MLVPHDYQYAAVSSIWEYFKTNTGNPLVAMPTGTGKSIVLAEFFRSALYHYPASRMMCLTHVKELIEQDYEELLGQWPQAPAGIYSASLKKRDVHNNIIFAGIASVAKKAALFGCIDLLLIDEAHLVSPTDNTMYNNFIADLRKINPNMKVVGLTATPWRLGSGMLTEGPIFTDVCFDLTGVESFNWLISQGYLMPLIPKPTTTMLDVSGVHLRGGEFIAGELQAAVDKAEVTHKALAEVCALGKDRQSWLIFASGVDHAKHIASMLTDDFDVTCKVVYSGMPDKDRDQILDDFKSGKLRAVVNNNILTTGFNHKALDLIVILRPTASTVLWVQMLGRGTRCVYAPGHDLSTQEGRFQAIAEGGKQNCLVLDFARNTKRLGQINDPVVPRKKGKGAGEAPVKLCECCDTYNHASARFCGGAPAPHQMPGFCGSEFIFKLKLGKEADTAELIKPTDVTIVETFKADQITYTRTVSRASNTPMIQVTYYCGLRMFKEFVCVEHENAYARHKAHQWWKARSHGISVPADTESALEVINSLKVPTHIRVWLNKKPYPEIMAFCFDGTAFGTQVAQVAPPPVQVHAPVQTDFSLEQPLTRKEEVLYNSAASQFLSDDDIPF